MKNISYTALKTFIDCPKRYSIKYEFGTPDTQSEWLILGKMLHSAIETYRDLGEATFRIFKDNLQEWYEQVTAKKLSEKAFYEQAEKSLNILHMVLQGFDFTGAVVEQEFITPYKEGYNLTGRVDFMSPSLLMDWKFKKDFRFLDPLQLSMYKKITGFQGETAFYVITWNGDFKLIKVNTESTDKILDEKLDALIEAVETGNFPANTKSCGLCPFKEVCNSSSAMEEFYLE
jgi:hypothetical protein